MGACGLLAVHTCSKQGAQGGEGLRDAGARQHGCSISICHPLAGAGRASRRPQVGVGVFALGLVADPQLKASIAGWHVLLGKVTFFGGICACVVRFAWSRRRWGAPHARRPRTCAHAMPRSCTALQASRQVPRVAHPSYLWRRPRPTPYVDSPMMPGCPPSSADRMG